MKKLNPNLVTVIIFLAVIFGFGGAFFLTEKKDFSENENRYLAKKPELNMEFASNIDDYVSDHFPMRDNFMTLASGYKLTLGMRDIDGAYVAKDRLMVKTEERDVDYDNINKNIWAINRFIEKNNISNAELLLIPTAALVYEDELPYMAPEFDQRTVIDNIKSNTDATVYDATEVLKQLGNESYYKTDHHFTSKGAYEAYRLLNTGAKATGFETVADDFYGSLFSKTLIKTTRPDTILKADITDNIQIKADGVMTDLYDYDALQTKDKYNFYLGGNYGRVDIDGKGQGTLLIIKDSFANSLVPYLINDYKKIIMIDPRYYMQPVKNIIFEENIDKVLFVYNVANFISDRNLIKIAM